MEWLREYINARMPEWKVPGLAIAIVKDSEVIFCEGFGWRDVSNQLPVTPKTLFAIASCSKAFTTTSIAILVDRQQLNWDKPVRDYLSTFKLYDNYASEHITLRDLVTHRSGLPRHDLLWYGTPFSRGELIDRLQYLEPSQELRAKYQYQNLMYATAGYIVDRVTNNSWEEFVRQEIFNPLGMNDSNFSVIQSQQTDDFALPYREWENEVKQIPFLNFDAIAPAGSINANISDLSKWLIFNLNQGKFNGKEIISATSLKEIHTPQIILSEPMRDCDEIWYQTYGLGWFIYPYRGHHLIEHGGNIDGFSALVALLPQEKIGMVILTNLMRTNLPTVIAYHVCDRLFKLEETNWSERFKQTEIRNQQEKETKEQKRKSEQKEGTQPSHPLEDYFGNYEHPGYGIIAIALKDENLQAIYYSIIFELKHYHYDIFEANSENWNEIKTISFFSDRQGNISGLFIDVEPNLKDVLFARVRSDRLSKF
jgi:CubicO group peptidase (beta-lactamase class C family)